MNFLRCIILLQFTAALAFGQAARQSQPASVPKSPEAMVRSLYREVVARHPLGIPGEAEMKIFAPHLSKALLHKIDLAIACERDEARQNPDPHMKPAIAWLEVGLFSGGDEQASPREFHIERSQPQKNGSFQVTVRLTWGPQDGPWIWRVAAIVMREDSRFVIDDVIYLKDDDQDDEVSLSELLTIGCDGPRWVGRRKR